MGTLRKVLLHGLPPALERALVEHATAQLLNFAPFQKKQAENSACLVITTPQKKKDITNPALPILLCEGKKPLRLGGILQDIQQISEEPSLYLDDFRIGAFMFSPSERKLIDEKGRDISLTDRECGILVYLARHLGDIVMRDNLLKDVFRYQDGIDTHTLETHIYRLRQKIELSADNPELLQTAQGGYILTQVEKAA